MLCCSCYASHTHAHDTRASLTCAHTYTCLLYFIYTLRYGASEAKIWADCDSVFKDIDQDGDGNISRAELVYLLEQILGRPPDPKEVDEAWLELLSKVQTQGLEQIDDEEDHMTVPQELFNEWFAKSVFFEDRQKAGSAIEDEHNGCFPAWPDESLQAKLLYIVSIPLVVPLYLTCPDVTKARFEKFYAVTFFMAIVWIAIFACKFVGVIFCGCLLRV